MNKYAKPQVPTGNCKTNTPQDANGHIQNKRPDNEPVSNATSSNWQLQDKQSQDTHGRNHNTAQIMNKSAAPQVPTGKCSTNKPQDTDCHNLNKRPDNEQVSNATSSNWQLLDKQAQDIGINLKQAGCEFEQASNCNLLKLHLLRKAVWQHG